MDLLKAEIERKKQSVLISSSNGANTPNKKRYITAAERRRILEEEAKAEEEALRERQRRRQESRSKRRWKDGDDSDDEAENGNGENLVTLLTKKYQHAEKKRGFEKRDVEENSSDANEGTRHRSESQSDGPNQRNNDDILNELKKLSSKEVANRLRGFGLPVRLFGEKDKDILDRLCSVMQGREAALLGEGEKDEFLLDSAHRTRNVFLEKDASNDDIGGRHAQKVHKKDTGVTHEDASYLIKSKTLTAEEQNDPPKRIYRYFKSLLRQWEEDLAQRADTIKRTAAGKNETKTLKQCKDYIRPLFQMCKRRELDDNMQNHLFKIVTYCEEGEFVKAHDSYIDVAIGRAAWPIGVTMVGIHARSGREKIGSSNVAHIMNSELHRKYLTSVKRLMSYAQRKRVDVDPSKKVVNL